MCLAVPGRIVEVTDTDPVTRSGRVSFGGVVRAVNLSCVPEANVDDYVIVHVGFAISQLDESEAQRVFAYLDELGELDDIRQG